MLGQRAGAALLIGTLSVLSTPHAISADLVTAENGAEVPMPQIDTMACDEISATLFEISSTGYRGAAPVPVDHPDRPIYDYENKLATVHYEDCQIGQTDFEAPSPVFSLGFD